MGLFKKKKTAKQQVLNDISLIKENSQFIGVLLVYAKEDEQLSKELTALQEKIKYLNPCDNEEILKMDGKIKDKLGDLKIFMNKGSQKNNFSGFEPFLRDIELLIAERNAKIL